MDVQQLFGNLQKEAECPLCLETVNNPKTLACLHSFTSSASTNMQASPEGSCKWRSNVRFVKKSFQIPEGDSFKNLPTSNHLNRLVDVFLGVNIRLLAKWRLVMFLQTTQAFPLKSNDPPLKLSSRRSWVEKPENYAEILKGMVVLKWQLDDLSIPSLGYPWLRQSFSENHARHCASPKCKKKKKKKKNSHCHRQ